MATKVIGDYTAAATIDGSTHYLLIQPGTSSTAYRKINRNVLLGITGQPMDTSTSQGVMNKSLDNTNTITVKDTLFTLQDDSDTTKQARFQLSGITTATTRTYTLPNASSTIADISTAQTFTNKTITSPTITGGSITGSTITTDAIIGQSSATSGTIYGLSIASSKVGTNGIITASVTDGAITPAKLQSGTGSSWTWQSYTPTFTNVTTGNGTITGKYIQIGKTVFFYARFVFGSTSAITGTVSISLPVTSINYTTAYTKVIGQVSAFDASAAQQYTGVSAWTNTTTVEPDITNVSGTYAVSSGITSTIPMTWATGDVLDLNGFYEAA